MLKINTAYMTRILLLDDNDAVATGATVSYIIVDESHNIHGSGTMTEDTTNTGIYYVSWTPNAAGTWTIKITCSNPARGISLEYQVGGGVEQDIYDEMPRIVCKMDFWSNQDNVVTLTAGGETGTVSLPDVVVAGIPANTTIIRVVALLKIGLIRDTSGSDNNVDVATGHVEVQKGGSGGYVTAIDIPNSSWSIIVANSSERGGDGIIGDNDLGPNGENKVDGNGTYNFQFDDIGAIGDLELHDVLVGLRIFFTV